MPSLKNKKVVVVMPAYNAEKTLQKTYDSMPHDLVHKIILVDDASRDRTADVAQGLGLQTIVHDKNKGYGGNQKTCYRAALDAGADIVVMLHPDYQYEPRLIEAMAAMIASGVYDVVLGSRILAQSSLAGGMPLYKYLSNRFLSFVQNILIGQKLSEYHTGYRAFSRKVLESLPLESNSDDFIFDNQMLVQAVYHGFKIGEISCPTKYFTEASSINFKRSVEYGLGVLRCSWQFFIQKLGFATYSLFDQKKASDSL
ncbi:MAG TPA: glycosyltransferase family 2 protein [Candidatus Omnitrophota bacterium]|nr:glycosyltransferase family 2 protein [Candidatus Omnitrophota bacterium]